MAADFRCEQCGNTIRAEVGSGEAVICPHCDATVTVPAGLASLPQPHVPPNAEGAAVPVSAAPPEEGEELAEEEEQGGEAVMAVMAAAMPWIVSLFLHLALFLILLLFIVLVINPPLDEDKIVIPSADLSDDAGGGNVAARDESPQSQTNRPQYASQHVSKAETPVVRSASNAKPLPVLSHGGSAGGGAPYRGLAGGSGSPGVGFYGRRGNAYHIVYVIDRSGSMMDSFDLVKRECAASIGRLSPRQDFHIILFADADVLEPKPAKLVKATQEAKEKAVEFLMPQKALAQTNPVPAIEQAFKVLAKADKKGKLIWLLTDGAFPDNRKVLRTIAILNQKKDVHIFTFLYGNRPRVAEEVLEAIAEKNGGKYKYVKGDE